MSTFVAASTANRSVVNLNAVGSYPTGWAAGDYLLAFLTSDASATTDDVTAAPTGWTKLSGPDDAITGTVDERLWCYGKFAQSGDNTTPTWTFSSGEDGQVNIVCVRGVDGTNPVNVITFNGTAAAAAHISAATNVTATAGMLVSFAAYDGGSVVTADPFTPPGTMTQAAEGGESTSGTYSASAYETFASSPGSITRTWTLGAGVVDDTVGVYLVALKDGTGGGGATDPAQNTSFSAVVDTEFALRFELQETGGASASLPGLHLYAQKNLTGGWARVTTSSNGLKIVSTARFVDGAATTDLMTAGTGTFVAGAGDEDGAVGAITLTASNHTEVEFALKITASEATIGDYWDIRVYKSDGIVLDSYTVTPRITASAPATTNPTIAVSPTSLSFNAIVGGGSPTSKIVNVSNTGGGTLAFTVSDDAAWLSVTPTSGTAPATLTVSVATGALAEGTYNGTITITDSGGTATNTPLTVPVSFVVGAVGSFPVEVEGVYGETSNRVAPILAPNGALYVLNEQPPTTTNSPAAIRKSTDGGSTWAEMDQVPDAFPGDHESNDFQLVGTDIHVVWQRSGYTAFHHVFNTTTDTYSLINETVQGTSRSATDQVCTAAHRSDGSIVAVYAQSATQLCYRIRSAGGTWGSETVLDSEAGKDFSQAFIRKSAIGDVVHIVYYCVTDGILYYRQLSAADVLSARTSVATGLYAGTSNTFRKALLNDNLHVWSNAGADRMYVVYRKLDGRLYGRQLDGTTPTVGSEEAVSTGFVGSSPPGIQSFQAVGSITLDAATNEIYALWADSTTGTGSGYPNPRVMGENLMKMRVRSAAGTWSAITEPNGTSEPIAAVDASVNTLSGTKYVTVFYDEYTAVDPGVSKFTRFAVVIGTTVSSGVANEQSVALAGVASNPATVAGNVATESDSAQGGTSVNPATIVGSVVAEDDAALPGTSANPFTAAASAVTEDDSAPSAAVVNPATIAAGVATESDTALIGSAAASQLVTGGVAAEDDASLTGSVANPTVVTGAVAAENDSAQAGLIAPGVAQALFTATKATIGSQTGPSWVITPDGADAVSIGWAASLATVATQVVIGAVSTEDDAAPIGTALNSFIVSGGVSTENDAAIAGIAALQILVTGGLATEDDAGAVGISSNPATIAAGVATENDSGQSGVAVNPATIVAGVASEDDSAPTGIVLSGLTQALYTAIKTTAGAQIGPSWTITPDGASALSVVWSGSVSTVPAIIVSGNVVSESDSATAGSVLGPQTISGGVAGEGDSALAGAISTWPIIAPMIFGEIGYAAAGSLISITTITSPIIAPLIFSEMGYSGAGSLSTTETTIAGGVATEDNASAAGTVGLAQGVTGGVATENDVVPAPLTQTTTIVSGGTAGESDSAPAGFSIHFILAIIDLPTFVVLDPQNVSSTVRSAPQIGVAVRNTVSGAVVEDYEAVVSVDRSSETSAVFQQNPSMLSLRRTEADASVERYESSTSVDGENAEVLIDG